MHFSVVVLTYFEPYWFATVKAVEDQARVPNTKVLLADSRFAERLAALSATELRTLSSWNIVFHDPQGNWGDHRNHVQQYIPNGSWVVMLDDDEIVVPSMLQTLEDFLSLGVHGMSAFLLPRINTYGELGQLPEVDWTSPSGLFYPDLQDRVFLNGSGVKYTGKVHERFELDERPMPILAPSLTIRHHKTREMQERSNVLWSALTSPEGSSNFYSQCGEDELLASLEIRLGARMARTIVELGAGHPEEISNSRYFLERGWCGLLVEGNPELADMLAAFYADDQNVTVVDCLVGKEDLDAVDFAISLRHWALSGVGGVSQPEAHDAGQVEMLTTSQRRASSVIRSWLETSGGSDVGILSIDLEGMDTEVLREIISAGLSPQVLVVERLTEADHVSQSELLQSSGYVYVEQRSLSDIWIRVDMADVLGGSPIDADSGVVEHLAFADPQPQIRYQHLSHPAERWTSLEELYHHYASTCRWKEYVRPGSLAIDIGAHSGDTTVVLAALVGTQGAVVAFDPNPVVFATLARNAQINSDYRIFAECLAISDVEGEACFADHNNLMCNGGLLTGLEAMGSEVVDKVTKLNPKTIPVQTVRLGSFLEERYPELLGLGVSFIKTDCEGFDGLIVRSLHDFVVKYRPVLFVEWFAWFNDDESRALFAAIESIGYVPMDPGTGAQAALDVRVPDLLCLPKQA